MMQDLTPHTLNKNGFELIEEVQHTDFSSFISKPKWYNSWLQIIYNLFIVLALIILGMFFIMSSEIIISRLLYTGLGILISFLLIPIHEYIHYLAYRYFGAKNISITTNIRQRYILTHADQFIVSQKEIKWIALLPFIIITSLCLGLLLGSNNLWQIALSTSMVLHTSICSADFRILDYFLSKKNKLVMFDDVQKGSTFFFRSRFKSKN